MTTRPAAVANMFYSGDSRVLHEDIQSYFAEINSEINPAPSTPKAIISPHAGYIYSGLTAAHAYAQLQHASDTIKRVVLLGPCHRVALRGLAAPSTDFFETPLGIIPIDQNIIKQLLAFSQVQISDLAHQHEHSLEVQLPFLQEVLTDFSLIPLVVGDATPQEVCEVIDQLWGGDETLIIISSDLSHFHDYETARAIDSETRDAIESFNIKAINHESACGCNSVNGLLQSAKKRNLKVTTLDIRNSADTAGTKDSVVGYGAWMFEETN